MLDYKDFMEAINHIQVYEIEEPKRMNNEVGDMTLFYQAFLSSLFIKLFYSN